MRRRTLFLSLFIFIFWSIPVALADGSWTVDLVAGQNDTIGTVNFTIADSTLTATYTVTVPGWCLTTTHFYASNIAPDRAAPGQFQYKHENLDCVTSDSFSVPRPAGNVYVAAHADADFDPNRAAEQDLIGNSGQLTVFSSTDTYFDASVDVAGLASEYDAWCVDREHFIDTGVNYAVDVYEDGNALVDKPDLLDNVLYVANQDYSSIGATAQDVQDAIWGLIDDYPVYLSPIAQQIIDDALINGEGFVPGCGQLAGVFMDAGATVQNIMVMVPVVCADGQARGETAWGLAEWGVEFRQGWGMYFLLETWDDEIVPEPVDPQPAPGEPVAGEQPQNSTDNGNRSRRDEAPGQNPDNDAPGSRAHESRGNGNGNGNNNGNSGNNGNRGNGN